MSTPTQIDPDVAAFPRAALHVPGYYSASAQDGMSLRAYFAGQALAGLLANPECDADYIGFALDAVKAADALIAELNKPKA